MIPRRGEKDYEPIVQGGSGYQQHVLGRARSAMLDALNVPRTISRFVSFLSEDSFDGTELEP